MRNGLGIIFGVALLVLPPACHAADLVVRDADTVKPDTALLETIARLRAVAAPGRKEDMAKVEAFFAPRVKAYQRSLDPFQPWMHSPDMTGDYLTGTIDFLVEQGEFPEGGTLPDYRPDAMKAIAGLLAEGTTFGTLKEAPGSLCAPAAYKVDRKAALAFAKKFELDAYSLRFYPRAVEFHGKPSVASPAKSIPARTLMMFEYDAGTPKDWGIYQTSGGTKGYMKDRDDTLGLSQYHICFAKLKGKYKISAIFGYGL